MGKIIIMLEPFYFTVININNQDLNLMSHLKIDLKYLIECAILNILYISLKNALYYYFENS